MGERPTYDVAGPVGGWGPPWPNVAEIATVLSPTMWTLVGGLMAQLHAIRHGVAPTRPTNDVDIVLHVETTRGVAATATRALESLGYRLAVPLEVRTGLAHRFIREDASVDVVIGGEDVVDVLVADHAPPRVAQRLRGRRMVAIEGGTQALRRTVNARLEIAPGRPTTISVPSTFGAIILKAAAYRSDPRDRQRHLQDAALLLSVLEDPYAERERFAGSDRSRLQSLVTALDADAAAWRALPTDRSRTGQAALGILTA